MKTWSNQPRPLIIIGLTALLAVPFLQAPASAAVSCTYDAGARRVAFTVTGGFGTLSRNSTGAILFGEESAQEPCGAATVTNTNNVVVTGSGANEFVQIRLIDEFGPGATLESSGVSEIEFSVNLRAGFDELQLSTSDRPSTLIFGSGTSGLPVARQIAIHDDADADIVASGVESFVAAGGAGDDVLSGLGRAGTGGFFPDPLILGGRTGTDVLVGGLAGDLILGNEGDDTLNGLAGDDGVHGEEGADVLNGGAGNDVLSDALGDEPGTFVPGPGDDRVFGGDSAFDTVSYQQASGPVTVNLATGEATGEGTDELTSIENAIGSPFADTLIGTSGPNRLEGGPGSDIAIGGPGDDELFSAEGPGDTFVPGPGIDRVTGSAAGRDTVSYAEASGPVDVNLGSGEAAGEGDDILSSIENVTGSNFGETLSGNADKNTLNGRGGDDRLQGAQEADTLFPGPGTDDVRGGAGLDTITYLDSNVPVVVNLGAGTATAQGTDTIALVENAAGSPFRDSLTGSAGANVLFGFDGDDDLFGLEGDDHLAGGNGNDNLNGGPGTDTCVQGGGTGPLTECENVGTFDVKPSAASVEAGERLTYLVSWTHPNRWRRLDSVELRVRHGDRVLTWVRWNQEGNTFQLFDPRDDRFGPAGSGGSRGVLTSPFARLHLRGSDAVAVDTQTIALLMRLSFRSSAIGEHVVEVTAEDDRNNRNAWEHAGTLEVAAR